MSQSQFERARMRAVLDRHGVRPVKKYGQNFISDRGILEQIADAAHVGSDDFVLEIGPGMGSLTKVLSERAGKVLAIEIDEKLIPVLSEELSEYPNVEIMQGDIMKLPVDELVSERAGERPVRVVANLPYYITTPILMNLLFSELVWESVTVMVQREVAERMTAAPGTKAYGALTLAVAYHADSEISFYLPPEAFFPPPKVESAVISLWRHKEPPVSACDKKLLFSLIRAAFNQRRKTLLNALSHGAGLSLSKEEIAAAIEAAGLSPAVRGEKLSLEEFGALCRLVTAKQS